MWRWNYGRQGYNTPLCYKVTKYANECDRNVEVAERTIVANTESFGGTTTKQLKKIGQDGRTSRN